MTNLTLTNYTCERCDHFLGEAARNHLDDGNRAECPRCGLGFVVGDDWLAENGYNTAAEAAVLTGEDPPVSWPLTGPWQF